MLRVYIVSHRGVVFDGAAQHVILPGEAGVFEVQGFHRPMMSRLLPGQIIVDGKLLPIRRGVAQVLRNRVTAIVENTS